MLITNGIASISVLLPFKNGKDVVNQIIPFKVFRDEKQYKAIPLITSGERKSAGLSEELIFTFHQNSIVAKAATNEAGVNAINNIASELKMLRII